MVARADREVLLDVGAEGDDVKALAEARRVEMIASFMFGCIKMEGVRG